MNIEELFTGVGMVIDDKIFDEKKSDRISRIVDALEEKNIPLLKYVDIPDKNVIKHCLNLNFILLDWELVALTDESGYPVSGMDLLKEKNKNRIISFIKEVIKQSFIPIFIFSNLNENDINKILESQRIIKSENNRPIFVKSKSELISGDKSLIFEKIEEWVNNMSSVYVLKKWDNSFNKAKSDLFRTFTDSAPHWPRVLMETAELDSANHSDEIAEVLSQNILSRMQPVTFEKEQIYKDTKSYSREETLLMLKHQRFTENIDKNSSYTGDFYDKKGKCFINIRPACDCFGRDGENKIYLIRCEAFKPDSEYNKTYGSLIERNNEALVGPLYKNKFYRFYFKDIIIENYDEYKEYKRGRILMPFITHITERYGAYIQRQALPRLPEKIIFEKVKTLKIEEYITEIEEAIEKPKKK